MTSTIDKWFFGKRILGYLAAFLAIGYCGEHFQSGPCTPNLDVFSWFLAALLSVPLLIKNAIQLSTSKDKKRMYSLGIHAVALLLLWILGNRG